MLALGIMSGTSADGIDVAAIEIGDERPRPAVRFVTHRHSDFPAGMRERILEAASGAALDAAAVARLHASLGDAYADAALATIAELGRRPALVALHGQTVAHDPGRGVTYQIGDAARVAMRTGVVTVADFRSADVAGGGQGAPLVPFADHLLFADGTPRALLNLGGIANLTLLPSARADDVIALDTGPGNMLIDTFAAMSGEPFDRDGTGAARGRVVAAALDRALADPFFARRAPKSTGREEFGGAFAAALLADVRAGGGGADDALATATALSARSVADALARETPPRTVWSELLVAGGGTRNATLLRLLAERVAPVRVRPIDELGIPAAAREAVAFAILGAYRLRGEPNTLPRCTGARRAVSAGAIHAP